MSWIAIAYRLPPGCGEDFVRRLAGPLIDNTPEAFEAEVERALDHARTEAESLHRRGLIGSEDIELAAIRLILAAMKRAKTVTIAGAADGGNA